MRIVIYMITGAMKNMYVDVKPFHKVMSTQFTTSMGMKVKLLTLLWSLENPELVKCDKLTRSISLIIGFHLYCMRLAN